MLWAELALRAVEAYADEIGAGGLDDPDLAPAFAAGLAANVDDGLGLEPDGWSDEEWRAYVAGFGEALRAVLASAEAALPWDLAGVAL